MNLRDLPYQLKLLFQSSPTAAIAILAAAFALASTPLAFALLGRQKWFQARRGRTLQRPSFGSALAGMVLVMGVPSIFLALMVKSESYDKNRYEFDPNRTFTPVDEGRRYESQNRLESVYRLDEAVRAEQDRLKIVRKDLVNGVKDLDKAMLTLREAARTSPTIAAPLNEVLEKLGGIRQAVGVDGPQQLMVAKAAPAALGGTNPNALMTAVASPAPVAAPVAEAPRSVPPPAAAAAPAAGGIDVPAILATVPEPQKALAAMLPLKDVPAGWVVAKIPGKNPPQYVETFNAENLFEKMDGRAESFIQNAVKGMACCSYHPQGDEESEVQLFIFEMGNPLKARGKFDSEKPDEAKPVSIGDGAYTASGSVFVHAAQYYTVVNVAQDDPKLANFALELAKKVVSGQKSATSTGPTADDIFALLPKEPKQSGAKYVAKDVFGYSFLADVFLADFEIGDMKFQGFLRPYSSPEEARKIFEQYQETAKKDGATIKAIEGVKADKMILSDNIGLVDVVFLKGNAVGGANGATEARAAEEFTRQFAQSLPDAVPVVGGEQKPASPDAKDDKTPSDH